MAAALRCAAVLALLCAPVAAHAGNVRQVALRHIGSDANELRFVRPLEFEHRLRVCNAFPYNAAMDVYRGKEKLTDKPMAYKDCRDFTAPLKSGDRLDFRVGDASAGTFSVADLPNNNAVLLLVVHRHDTLSTVVSFESHVFADLQNAQVAVIDTYKGSEQAKPQILDRPVPGKGQRKEELRYDSVVAVSPGVYEVELSGKDGVTKARKELVAMNHTSYVVLRTGVEAGQGPAFPEELVVFPHIDPSAVQGAAATQSTWLMLVVGFTVLAVQP
mmetsp:Transcript_55684/g.129670  ORF Transcript_55684/g.129670 Transcript_55684/m.129670 type:complete len:273 (+) Transcript_55684:60-878(+)